MAMDKFYNILYEWLFQEKKTFNPFTRYLAELAENNPKVPQPKIHEPEVSLEIIEENRAVEFQNYEKRNK